MEWIWVIIVSYRGIGLDPPTHRPIYPRESAVKVLSTFWLLFHGQDHLVLSDSIMCIFLPINHHRHGSMRRKWYATPVITRLDYDPSDGTHSPIKYCDGVRNDARIRKCTGRLSKSHLTSSIVPNVMRKSRLKYRKSDYRSDTANSNTVNSKFHLIRSLGEDLARFLLFHV